MQETIITIPSSIAKGEELIAIPRSVFEEFSRWKKERRMVDEVIASGEDALKKGQTIVADSSKEALKILHGRENNK